MDHLIDDLTPAELFEEEPDWTDLDAVRGLVLAPWDERAEPPIRIGHHPLFEPWRAQIIQTAALQAPLLFGDDPGDAVASRGGGRDAHLSSPTPPTCGRCAEPLTLCFQLQPKLLAPWIALDGALTAAYCFGCHPDSADVYDYATGESWDGTLACRIGVERPNHLVAFGEPTEPARELTVVQRWDFPDIHFTGPFSESGAVAVMLHSADFEVGEEYMALVFARGGYASPHVTGGGEKLVPGEEWRTAVGGYPSWDQEDVTPTCPDCQQPMKLVVDYNGHLFLDGSLHVFVCTCGPSPRFDFVAEF